MIEGFLGIFLIFFMTTEMRDLCYCLEQKGMSPAATFMVLSTFSGITSIKDKLNPAKLIEKLIAVLAIVICIAGTFVCKKYL